MKGSNYTLITGSSGFLGKVISKALINSNKNLFISDLNEAATNGDGNFKSYISTHICLGILKS